MKKVLWMMAIIFITGCSPPGDTANNPSTNSLSEGSTVTITIDNTRDDLIVPECTACDSLDMKINAVYNQIIQIAEMFLNSLDMKNNQNGEDVSGNISITVKVVNDLVADSVSELNDGADSQEVITDFKSAIDELSGAAGQNT